MAGTAQVSPIVQSPKPDGDTAKVNRSSVLFVWEKKVKKYTFLNGVRQPGTYEVKKANFIMLLPEATRDYFNIPQYTPSQELADQIETYDVAAYSYTRYKNIGENTGVSVAVKAHKRKKPAPIPSARLDKISVIIPLLDRKTAKGNYRTVSLSFPAFFSVTMLCQAIGTALKNSQVDRKPSYFLFEGKREAIPYGATGGSPFTGMDHGAWLATAEIVPSGGATNVILASSAGDFDGTTTGG